MQPLRVLSLWQPWASAIPLGFKAAETRGRPAPSTILGKRIALHAAVRVSGRRGTVTEVGQTSIERDAAGYLLRDDRLGWPYRLPLGAIVATAKVVCSVRTDDCFVSADVERGWRRGNGTTVWISEDEFQWGDYELGRHAWLLADIEPLAEPAPFIGGQGLSKSWTPAAAA